MCDFELLQGSPIKVVCTVFIVFYKYGQQTCHSCPVFKFKGSIETCCNDKLTKNLRLNASRFMDLGKERQIMESIYREGPGVLVCGC